MDFSKLKNLLDDQMQWPASYSFKFVVKTEKKHEVLALLNDHKNSEKLSKNGKYTSITASKTHNCSDDIIAVYKRMSTIEGVIHL